MQGNGAAPKAMRDDDVRKLVAEENASRSKFPRYPGLERYELLEKMGDGAFSNVYRARDLEGDAGEVGIKVVRKFEMNSMQVSRLACAMHPGCPRSVSQSLLSRQLHTSTHEGLPFHKFHSSPHFPLALSPFCNGVVA